MHFFRCSPDRKDISCHSYLQDCDQPRKPTRRKSNIGSVWATGEEAGIVNKDASDTETPDKEKASEDTDDNDGPDDDILNMFGD